MENVLTVREVSDFLLISFSTAYELVRSRKIKAFKAGGRWRIFKKDLEPYINRGDDNATV